MRFSVAAKLRRLGIVGTLLAGCVVAGCSWGSGSNEGGHSGDGGAGTAVVDDRAVLEERGPSEVFYEIFVRSFYDSDGDGIGDLNGITAKLDYLNDGNPETNDDLGVTGIWLMPINPSPGYHGYDVTDYYDVNPEYGTIEDLQHLVEEAHKRGIQVIMDLVVNHTSSEHPWFKESITDPNAAHHDWYTWRAPDEQAPSISATGGKAWHERNGQTYLGVFWDGMPDLNFANPDVRAEMIKIGQFWLELGIDGFRLDAAKHIFEDFSGDEKKPELAKDNLAWWKEFRTGLESVNPNVYIVGEVWDVSVARVAPYLSVFDSAFNFAAGEMMTSSAAKEDDSNLAFSLERIYGAYEQASGGQFVDAPFLTNHDQNRVMSALHGNVNEAKMAAAMLFTLPGRPFVYYGEEIGLQGVKPDEEIREPMKWEGDAAEDQGQTSWRMPRHQADTPSVAEQDGDPHSLLNHYRMLIHWRSYLPVLVDGAIVDVATESSQVMAYERRGAAERVLVLHNLGGLEQTVELKADSDGQEYEVLVLVSNNAIGLNDGAVVLPPYSTAILR